MKVITYLLLFVTGVCFCCAGPTVYAQNCPNCPPAQYTNQVFPWAPGQAVSISFDANGKGFTPPNSGGSIELTPDPSNAAPKFSLNPDLATAFANGAAGWNGQAQADGSGVTFAQQLTYGPGNWIVSPTWPKATITYQTSGGQVKTMTIDYSDQPASTVAVTSYLPDYDANGHRLIAAAAAVTLINTNGSYSANGVTYPLFDSSKPNFLNALQGLGTHESGHGFSLGDVHGACGDPMSQWQASAANPGGGTNNQSGCQTSNISCCDDNEIKNARTIFTVALTVPRRHRHHLWVLPAQRRSRPAVMTRSLNATTLRASGNVSIRGSVWGQPLLVRMEVMLFVTSVSGVVELSPRANASGRNRLVQTALWRLATTTFGPVQRHRAAIRAIRAVRTITPTILVA